MLETNVPQKADPIDCGEINQLIAAKHGWMLVNRNDYYIGRSIIEFGEFSEGEIDVFSQLLRPGCVVVEAGANIGTHTVPLAKLVGPPGKVICFEPQRIVYQTLCANLALNSLTNVVAHWSGLGESHGSLFVPAIDYSVQQNFGGISLENYDSGERVPLVPLDDFELPRLDMLKADVEGMELSVLKGGTATLERCRPVLYVECDRKDRAPDLINHLFQLGYISYWHRPPLFNPQNYFGNAVNPFGQVASFNILAIHPVKRIVIQGLPLVEKP